MEGKNPLGPRFAQAFMNLNRDYLSKFIATMHECIHVFKLASARLMLLKTDLKQPSFDDANPYFRTA